MRRLQQCSGLYCKQPDYTVVMILLEVLVIVEGVEAVGMEVGTMMTTVVEEEMA